MLFVTGIIVGLVIGIIFLVLDLYVINRTGGVIKKIEKAVSQKGEIIKNKPIELIARQELFKKASKNGEDIIMWK